jgi:mannose-6-phosphate isomerase-like protein (cupin superfamily)
VGQRIEKPWGWSEEVYRDGRVSIVRIQVVPGGYCSWHKHQRKNNLFLVTSGELHVLERCDEDHDCDVALPLQGGMSETVWAGMLHRFENRTNEPVEAVEIYVSLDHTPPDDQDIVRFGQGGVA